MAETQENTTPQTTEDTTTDEDNQKATEDALRKEHSEFFGKPSDASSEDTQQGEESAEDAPEQESTDEDESPELTKAQRRVMDWYPDLDEKAVRDLPDEALDQLDQARKHISQQYQKMGEKRQKSEESEDDGEPISAPELTDEDDLMEESTREKLSTYHQKVAQTVSDLSRKVQELEQKESYRAEQDVKRQYDAFYQSLDSETYPGLAPGNEDQSLRELHQQKTRVVYEGMTATGDNVTLEEAMKEALNLVSPGAAEKAAQNKKSKQAKDRRKKFTPRPSQGAQRKTGEPQTEAEAERVIREKAADVAPGFFK